MKKILSVLLAMCILLIPATVAHADVIIEPQDLFYMFNASDCEYLGQSFFVKGAGGSISVKEEPGSETEVAVFKNGTELYVYCTYKLEGKDWGLVVEKEDMLEVAGWVSIDELVSVMNANPPTGEEPVPVRVILPVVVVAVGAAILIRVFWKPKKG